MVYDVGNDSKQQGLCNGERWNMNFKDHWVTLDDDKKFIFTVEMQRSLSEAGLPVEPASLTSFPDFAHNVGSHRVSITDTAVKHVQHVTTPEVVYDREPEAFEEIDFEVPLDIQIEPETGKYIGRIKWYNIRKGYGFIIRGGGEEIFFHKSGALEDPTAFKDGQWVLYDVEVTQKGPEATDVESYDYNSHEEE